MDVLRVVDICGRAVRVIEATNEEYPDLNGNDGCYDTSTAAIYMVPGHAETVRIDTYLHELVHAVSDATGLRLKLQEASEAMGKECDWLEEEVVRSLVSGLRGGIKSAGWREPKQVAKAKRKPRAKKETT